MISIAIDSIDELPAAAARIVPMFEGHSVVAFYGAMGAGKTTLIRELCRQMGVMDVVTSPTFALVNQYDSAQVGSIFHFDFYRIEHLEEVFDFGYEEYFYGEGLCLVEWPEKIEGLLPEDVLRITISTDELLPGRRIFEIAQ